MKIKLIIYTYCVIIISLCNTAYAQVELKKVGTSTMNFLLVGVSPRACSMGEAFSAAGSGTESMFYNPAGLAEMEKKYEAGVNYTKWIASINYLGGSVGINLGNMGAVGLSLMTVDYGQINGTRLLDLSERASHPEGYVDLGNLSNVGAYVVGLTYAKAISTQFLMGGSIKLAGQNLGSSDLGHGNVKDNNATKLLFDAGVKYNTGFNGFSFGMAIRNFASNLKREEISEPLPITFSLGVSFNLVDFVAPELSKDNSLLVAADYMHFNNYSERINYGAEYKFMNFLFVRGGYQTNRDLASWSGGLGLAYSLFDYDLQVDYSYSSFDTFDGVNRVSLRFAF